MRARCTSASPTFSHSDMAAHGWRKPCADSDPDYVSQEVVTDLPGQLQKHEPVFRVEEVPQSDVEVLLDGNSSCKDAVKFKHTEGARAAGRAWQ